MKPPRPSGSVNTRGAEEREAARKAAYEYRAKRSVRQGAVASQVAKKKAQAAPEPDEGWRPMKAKFPGVCKWCRRAITRDASIYWSLDHGAYHTACYNKSKSST